MCVFKRPLDIPHVSAADLSNIHCRHQSERFECIHRSHELHDKCVELAQGLNLWTCCYFINWDALPGHVLLASFVVIFKFCEPLV